MTRVRTEQATYDTIERLAIDAFRDHALELRHRASPANEPFRGTFDIKNKNGSSVYGFRVFVDSGVVVFWGDLGEFVLRHCEFDSLRWLLDAGVGYDKESDGEHWCDYLLGKVRASDGDRREFMIDDDWETEVKNNGCPDSDDGTDEATYRARRDYELQLEQVATVREALREVECDPPTWQRHTWAQVMHEVGYDDPPRCDGWAPSMLWLWQCVKLFRRLYKATKPDSPIADTPKVRVGYADANGVLRTEYIDPISIGQAVTSSPNQVK